MEFEKIIVQRLAEMDPYSDEVGCIFCGAFTFNNKYHEEDCIWVMANELRKEEGY